MKIEWTRIKPDQELILLIGSTKNARYGRFDLKKLVEVFAPELSKSEIKRLIQQGSMEMAIIDKIKK